jgi:uncharacterized protein (DUF58 family)
MAIDADQTSRLANDEVYARLRSIDNSDWQPIPAGRDRTQLHWLLSELHNRRLRPLTIAELLVIDGPDRRQPRASANLSPELSDLL